MKKFWKRFDFHAGELVPKEPAILYGRYTHAGVVKKYCFIRLPSYQWRHDLYRDRFCWHRMVLQYVAYVEGCRQFDSPSDGWHVVWEPLEWAA